MKDFSIARNSVEQYYQSCFRSLSSNLKNPYKEVPAKKSLMRPPPQRAEATLDRSFDLSMST